MKYKYIIIFVLTIIIVKLSYHNYVNDYVNHNAIDYFHGGIKYINNNDNDHINYKTKDEKIRIYLSEHGNEFEDINSTQPDVNDRKTLLMLAQMSANAYILPENENWINLPSEWNENVHSFGWNPDDDGLRGHVYSTKDNSTIVIAIKGTSAGLIGGGGPSSKNDKFNDNLLFSCCCARVSWTWTPVCDCFNGGWQCKQGCLEKNVNEESVYYPVAIDLFNNMTYLYPNANIWLTGHSLGGSLASMMGLTFGVPAVTFEALGDRLPAQRLHLPQPPPELSGVYHVYHTADPIPQGTCNGLLSPCNAAGFALESRCHTGLSIVFDTIKQFNWSVDLRTHRILTVINEILSFDWEDDDGKVYLPTPTHEEDCIDCFKWEFGNEE